MEKKFEAKGLIFTILLGLLLVTIIYKVVHHRQKEVEAVILEESGRL